GRLDDPLETEADSVAERVLRMPDRRPIESVPAQLTEERPLGDTSDSKRGQAVRARPAAPTAHLDGKEAPAAVRDVLATAGAPLDSETRAFFEARFGQEFSGVRVHHDAPAAASALEVGARAYTVRSDIVFAPGAYAPNTGAGRLLIAHELAHVVQQTAAPPITRRPAFQAHDEADLEDLANAGATESRTAVLRRQPAPAAAGAVAGAEHVLSRPEEIALSRTSDGQFAVSLWPPAL